jgi:FKBP-type peptidyl-prolyl cis-trans isomerase
MSDSDIEEHEINADEPMSDEEDVINNDVEPMPAKPMEKLEPYVQGPDAIDISPDKDGGVLKEIRRAGVGDESPRIGDKVFVHYVGTLTDGSKFDSSRDRGQQFEFSLGTGSVIKAWDIGVATMKRGELAVLLCKPEYAYGKRGSPPNIPPDSSLVFEVELFDWKAEDVSENKDEGVMRHQIVKGDGYMTPRDGATCDIHIIGRYNGVQFEDRDVTVVIGEGSEVGVVEGVEQALKKFKKGEKSQLEVKSRYAYGKDGNAAYNIPSDADLEYEVELKNFEKAKESWEMDINEKLEQSEICKNKGTNYFKAGKYKMAVKLYTRITDMLKSEEDSDNEQRKSLLLAAHLNLAMCHLKLSDDTTALHCCNDALALDVKNEKGLFRRGMANLNLQNYEEAIADFKSVLEIDPDNKAAKNQIAIAGHKIKQIRLKEKQTYAGMFQKFAAIDAKKEAATGSGDSTAVNGTPSPPAAESMEQSATS